MAFWILLAGFRLWLIDWIYTSDTHRITSPPHQCFFADLSCGRHFFLCLLRTYLVADISFLFFCGHIFCVFCRSILWRTLVFVFFIDICCGAHFFLCFCGHILWRTFLHLADTTGPDRPYVVCTKWFCVTFSPYIRYIYRWNMWHTSQQTRRINSILV